MFKILTIPFDTTSGGFDEEPLNRFLANKKVKSYRAEFFSENGRPFWTVFLEYDSLLPPSSPKETDGLDEPQKILLDKLKAWRKERAEKDGVPVYIIGTNREFRDIAVNKPETVEALKAVKGFGKAKIGKYGKEIVELVKAFYA
jgi:superfamily II DNA helicase RecQ